MSVKAYMLQQKERVMNTDMFLLKKKLLVMSLFIRYALCGVEYSVVLPTALLYMKSLNAGTFFTGVTIAAYPAAAMISLPLFGYLYDKTQRIRELLLVLNFFELIGNILYAMPYSKWYPGFGRFIAGLGDGFLALSIGEVANIYPTSQRLVILSIMEFGRIAGIMIGPSFNVIIKGQRYFISTWVLDDNTFPGVLMAFLWLLMELITVFCVFNLAKELTACNKPDEQITKKPLLEEPRDQFSDNEEAEENLKSVEGIVTSKEMKESVVAEEPEESLEDKDEDSSSSESESIASNASNWSKKSISSQQLQSDLSTTSTTESIKKSYYEMLVEIVSVEFVIVVVVDFVLWFSQTNMEILAPYITEFSYHWSPATAGLVYVVGGVVITFAFVILYILATKLKVKDTSLLIGSLVLTQMGTALLIYETIPIDIPTRVGVFCATAICLFAAIPLNLVCSKNLLTKLFHPELQGMVQGISSSVSRITMITGPIISGYVYKDRRTYGAIVSVVCFFTIIIFFFCVKRINKRVRKLRKSLKNSEKGAEQE